MAGMRPVPVIDNDSKPFWEGVKKHKLMLQKCECCHQYIFYPRIICPHCFSEELTWEETSGQGEIHSYTVVHKSHPAFKEETPYVIGIIDLKEGVRMLSRIVGSRNQIEIGKQVSVIFEKIDDDVTLPYFQLT